MSMILISIHATLHAIPYIHVLRYSCMLTKEKVNQVTSPLLYPLGGDRPDAVTTQASLDA